MSDDPKNGELAAPGDREFALAAVKAIALLAASMPKEESRLAAHVLDIALREKRRIAGIP